MITHQQYNNALKEIKYFEALEYPTDGQARELERNKETVEVYNKQLENNKLERKAKENERQELARQHKTSRTV